MAQGFANVYNTVSVNVSMINMSFTLMSATTQSIVSSMMSNLSSQFASGMSSSRSQVSSGMSSIVSTISSYSGSAQSAGYNVGYYISAGIASGMYSNMWSIESAANRIIAKAREAARAAADIHSPSRMFAKEVGKFIPQEIAMGIDNEMPSTIKQMSK